MTRPDVIVTDGLWRLSVSAIRALGKAGYPVTVLGESVLTSGFWSRWASRRVELPSAESDAAAFGARFESLLDEYAAPPIVLATTDGSARFLVENRERLSNKAHFLVPPRAAFEVASDKGRTAALAKELGVAAPTTWQPTTVDELVAIIAMLPAGEFICKPRAGRGSAGLVYGEHLAKEEWLARWEKHGAHVVQTRLPRDGETVGICLLYDRDTRLRAAFAHRRLREYPVSGGPSTDRESIALPDALVEQSRRVLEHLGWQGVAMCEWKQDPRTGEFQLLEVNPRFWGSLELAVRAGVNFPVLYAEVAAGGAPKPVMGGTPGVRCRWVVPGEMLRWASSARGAREPIGEFLRGLPALAEEWDPTDKRGALAIVVCTFSLALNPKYWKYSRAR